MNNIRDQIIRLWMDCLPGTPRKRYDWMQSGNPAGPVKWFLAKKKEDGKVIGSTSIMPRDVMLNGIKMRGGIIGDIMVDTKFRKLGICTRILGKIKNELSTLGIDFVYVVPNNNSKKVLKEVGFEKIAELKTFVRPVRIEYFIKRFKNKSIIDLLSPIVGFGIKTLSKGTYTSSAGFFENVYANFDMSFNSFWHKIQNIQNIVIGCRNLQYLKWRYESNPLLKFKVLVIRSSIDREINGYLVYTIEKRKLRIFDMVALHARYANKLLSKIIHIAQANQCVGVYIRLTLNNPWVKIVKKHCFFDTGDRDSLLFLGNNKILLHPWQFYTGDRNI